MNKDLWIDGYDRLLEEGEELGMTPTEAEAYAERYAHDRFVGRIADMADHARLLKKEGRV